MQTESAVITVPGAEAFPWFVAHTRPRREKKVLAYCQREGIATTLPCYRSIKKYRGKTVTFEKPLFPNYVFLRLDAPRRQKIYQSDHIAALLEVTDQVTFVRQLGDILLALETEVEVFLAPQIIAGARVKVRSGPLRGLEGMVRERKGRTTVHLRLDFISQSAAVVIDAEDLELVDEAVAA